MKKTILATALALAAVCGHAEVATSLFLIGEPAGGWDTSKGIEMTKTADGVFEIDVEFSGTNSFGFVKNLGGDWTAFNSCRYTPTTKGAVPVEGENEMVYTGDDSNDYSWDLGAGSYHFTVNTNTMKFIIGDGAGPGPAPTPSADLYFVGEANNWNFLDRYLMSREGNIYTFTAGTIRAGIEFKLSDRDWKTSYTTLDRAMKPGNTYEVTTGDGLLNMAFDVDVANARLVLDTEAMTLEVIGEAGVDDIEADGSDAPAEYYTLTGQYVAAPGPGIYIVRRGASVTKAVIR